jgi:hypothetical protein
MIKMLKYLVEPMSYRTFLVESQQGVNYYEELAQLNHLLVEEVEYNYLTGAYIVVLLGSSERMNWLFGEIK